MKISYGVIGCFVFLLLLGTYTHAGLEMPAALQADFPQYPGSQLLQVTSMGGSTIVLMDCGTAKMDEIYTFYSSKAKKSGWKMQMESKQQEVMLFSAEKGNKKIMITVAVEEGKTAVGMTLSTDK